MSIWKDISTCKLRYTMETLLFSLLIVSLFCHNFGIASGQTPGFLPDHPTLKKSDKNSVPPATGKEVQIGNLTVYESPRLNETKLMLITIYDIFGFHPHVKYIADKLSEAGFFVVIPDLLHGNPVPLENFPQPDFKERAVELFAKNGSWTENKPDLLSVIKHYKKEYGITGVGMYGYCWGGKISVYAAADPDFSDLNAIGLVHPSRVTTEDANEIKVPAILLPSGDEPFMLPFLRILNTNVRNLPSEHHRYSGMNHGFAGARSDFSEKKIRENVDDVIFRMSKFFKRVLPNQ